MSETMTALSLRERAAAAWESERARERREHDVRVAETVARRKQELADEMMRVLGEDVNEADMGVVLPTSQNHGDGRVDTRRIRATVVVDGLAFTVNQEVNEYSPSVLALVLACARCGGPVLRNVYSLSYVAQLLSEPTHTHTFDCMADEDEV